MYRCHSVFFFVLFFFFSLVFFFQAEDGIRDLVRSRGLGDVYKRQVVGVVEKPDEGKQPSNVIRHVFDYFEDPKEYIALIDRYLSLIHI